MTCCIMESSATTVTLLSRRLNARVLTLVNPFFTKITWRKWKIIEFSLFADDKHFTFFAKARNITETSRTALYEPCVRSSVFMRYSEIIQVFLEYIMCRQAGVGQLAFFSIPFLQSAVIKHFYAVLYNKRYIPSPWVWHPLRFCAVCSRSFRLKTTARRLVSTPALLLVG